MKPKLPSVRKAIVKVGESSEEFVIPPEYIQKPPKRGEEVKVEKIEKQSNYLRQMDTKRIYPWSAAKAARADMEPYEFPVPDPVKEEEEYDKFCKERDAEEESIIPPEGLDDLMQDAMETGEVEEQTVGEVVEEMPITQPTPGLSTLTAEQERKDVIREAVGKILPEEYVKAIGTRPAMPRVKQVSDLCGFKVTSAEIAEIMGE